MPQPSENNSVDQQPKEASADWLNRMAKSSADTAASHLEGPILNLCYKTDCLKGAVLAFPRPTPIKVQYS
jgi:hypothetical protein